MMPKWGPIKEWTHEEIWDLILDGGQNANPDDVPMKIFNPLTKSDYFAEGIKYGSLLNQDVHSGITASAVATAFAY